MKAKLVSMVMILSLIFCSCACSEEESVPSEIINDVKEMEIISSTHAALPDGYCWFVLAKKRERINHFEILRTKWQPFSLTV